MPVTAITAEAAPSQQAPAIAAAALLSTSGTPAPGGTAGATDAAAVGVGASCPRGFTCDYDALSRTPQPIVDAIRVEKTAHRMHLLTKGVVVKTYRVAIGWGGAGPKLREGDAVTPVGTYKITGRLAKSPWHVLLGVSYPNYEDVKRHARNKAEGKIPHDAGIGFGIAIHGRSAAMKDGEHKQSDWTLGCIAVDNDEIEEISSLVKKETEVVIVD